MPSYQAIRQFIDEQVAHRDTVAPMGSFFRPSEYWLEFNRYSRYVRTLPDDELELIRYHTWHLNGDLYLTYLFQPEMRDRIVGVYEQLISSLDGFTPSEPANGIGFDTEYGKIGLDVARYLLPLRDARVAGVLSRSQPQALLEIGGGYGGVARLALQYNPNVAYVICDLEETLFFSAVFLTQELGAERLHLVGGSDEINGHLQPGHAYLVPQVRREVLRQLRFDLTINQQSMQEMTPEQVKQYCDLVSELGGYFYSCNMNEHAPDITSRTNIIRGVNDYLESRFERQWHSKDPQGEVPDVTSEPVLFSDLLFDRTVYRVTSSGMSL